MQLSLDAVLKLSAPVLTGVIGWISKRYFEAKPKLISYLVHASAIPFIDDKGTQLDTVNTHSIVVRNAGKKTANNIRIGHHKLPPSFQVYPPVIYTIEKGANESAEILVPTLVPNEQVSISYLYFPPLTFHGINSYTKSDESFAQIIDVIPSPKPSKISLVIFWGFTFVGASTFLYWLVQWAIRAVSAGA